MQGEFADEAEVVDQASPVPQSPVAMHESAGFTTPAPLEEAPHQEPGALDAVAAPALAPEAEPVVTPPSYVPRPKVPIHPERADDGTYRTQGVVIERGPGRSVFVLVHPPVGPSHRIYVHDHSFDRLLTLATQSLWEPGKLWSTLCDIPLERPLPSRRLEEELRALLVTFGAELSTPAQ